jgi:hypothetical protein
VFFCLGGGPVEDDVVYFKFGLVLSVVDDVFIEYRHQLFRLVSSSRTNDV